MVRIRPQRHVSNKQIFADGHPTVSNLKLGVRTQIPGQFSGTNQNSQRDSLFPLNLPLLLLPRHNLPVSTQPPIFLFCTDLQQSPGFLLPRHGASSAGQQLSSAPKHKTSPDWIRASSISFTQDISDYSSSSKTSKQAHIRRGIKTQEPRNKVQGFLYIFF